MTMIRSIARNSKTDTWLKLMIWCHKVLGLSIARWGGLVQYFQIFPQKNFISFLDYDYNNAIYWILVCRYRYVFKQVNVTLE